MVQLTCHQTTHQIIFLPAFKIHMKKKTYFIFSLLYNNWRNFINYGWWVPGDDDDETDWGEKKYWVVPGWEEVKWFVTTSHNSHRLIQVNDRYVYFIWPHVLARWHDAGYSWIHTHKEQQKKKKNENMCVCMYLQVDAKKIQEWGKVYIIWCHCWNWLQMIL